MRQTIRLKWICTKDSKKRGSKPGGKPPKTRMRRVVACCLSGVWREGWRRASHLSLKLERANFFLPLHSDTAVVREFETRWIAVERGCCSLMQKSARCSRLSTSFWPHRGQVKSFSSIIVGFPILSCLAKAVKVGRVLQRAWLIIADHFGRVVRDWWCGRSLDLMLLMFGWKRDEKKGCARSELFISSFHCWKHTEALVVLIAVTNFLYSSLSSSALLGQRGWKNSRLIAQHQL